MAMTDPEFRLEELKRCVERLRKISGDQFAERMARALEHSLAIHTLGVKNAETVTADSKTADDSTKPTTPA